jgi:branched-chain amino acid transport system permease protein
VNAIASLANYRHDKAGHGWGGRQRVCGLIVLAAVFLLTPWVVGAVGGNYWVRVLDFALLYIMLALGLNIIVGYTGLLDLGFIVFYAVGAYTAALLASPHLPGQFAMLAQWFPQGLHTSIWLIMLAAVALAVTCGIALGVPTLRLRGDYLAIVTLGFGEIIRILMRNLDRPVNITNGAKGITSVDPVYLFGINLGRPLEMFGQRIPSVYLYYYLFAVFVLSIALLCARLQDSRIGRAWEAIREDEDAARAMGIDTRRLKLTAFAMGAVFGGMAGALFASFQGFVSPESFTFHESIAVLAMVVLGGMGHICGVVLGCALLAALPEVLRASVGPLQQSLFGRVWMDPEVVRQLFFGLALILAMLYKPSGLWPSVRGVK